MKEYKMSIDEQNYLMTVVINTRNDYLRKIEKRESIAKFENIDDYQNFSSEDYFDELEDEFFTNEILRISKPYLKTREFNILKDALYNLKNIKEFKIYLRENKRYDYLILLKVFKKIGGIFNG